ncbi:MAG TPA: Gfo/Idh/MocA family oxidoreductase, partial [Blastocatellia bacterium]|nr:Gfo/Idh/MocA family oxidoreductase [Blastocatellia bacterium]
MKKGGSKLSRRDMIKSAAIAGATLGLTDLRASSTPAEEMTAPLPAATVIGMKFEPRSVVRVGIIGVGARGTSMLAEFLGVEGVQITALCDIVKDKCLNAQSVIEKAGHKQPALFFNGDHDFENLCKRDDLDFIYIATPWDWHVPMAVAAMKNGKHTGVEVPAAVTLKECWELVDTSEKTRRHCIMMENCCYGANEMLVLNMVRAGLFGELLHGEAAYIHDLRALLFEDQSEGLWRRFPHITRDGNLYPTHGLGPVAQYMDVNRGDRFDYLVSVSSPSVSLA